MDSGVMIRLVHGNFLSRLLTVGLTILILVLASASTGLAADADKVVVTVNGQELKQLHFDRVMDKIFPLSGSHGGISEEKKARNMKKAVDRLIDEELLYQEAKRLGIKPDKKDLKIKLEKSIERVGGKERFNEALEHYGVSLKEFKRTLGKPGMVKEYLEKNVESKSEVSQEEVRAYYEKNRESHFMVHKRRFRHIVLKTDPGEQSSWDVKKEKASGILENIRKGADFAEMAQKFSEGPRREKGGDTGYIARGQLLPELVKAGWDMKPGDVSDIIMTIYGFHIIKLEGPQISEEVSFAEAGGQIESMLVSSKKQALKRAIIDGLRKKASIRMVNE